MSLSNPLFPADYLIQRSKMMLFACHESPLHAFHACSRVFYHPSLLWSNKLLLLQPPFHVQKIWGKQNWDLNLKWHWKEYLSFTLDSSNATKLNWNESQLILCVSNTYLYFSMRFLSMSNDNWRYDRWSCCFEETKMKNVISVK